MLFPLSVCCRHSGQTRSKGVVIYGLAWLEAGPPSLSCYSKCSLFLGTLSVLSETAANTPAPFAFLPLVRGEKGPPFLSPKKKATIPNFQQPIQTRMNTACVESLCKARDQRGWRGSACRGCSDQGCSNFAWNHQS